MIDLYGNYLLFFDCITFEYQETVAKQPALSSAGFLVV